MKFTKEDYLKLFDLGKNLMPLTLIGSEFQVINSEFITAYQSDKNAQISYEAGKAERYKDTVNNILKAGEEGDLKANIHIIEKLAGSSVEVKKSQEVATVEKKVVKKKVGLQHLTDPTLLLKSLKN